MDAAEIVDCDAVKAVFLNDKGKGIVIDFSSDFYVELLVHL